MSEDPGTLDKIKQLAKRVFGVDSSASTEETGIGLQRPVTKEMEAYDRQAVRSDRRTKIRDCQKMAAVDARIARMIHKLAGDAVVGGVTVRVESAVDDSTKDKSQQLIDALIRKCNIEAKLKGWVSALLRGGELFWEIVVNDSTRQIVRVKKLATIITFSSENAEGNFPEGEPAYYQEHPWTRERIKAFEPWQIVHVKWADEDGKLYGEPLFSAARLAYERLDSGEKNITLRRAIRAGKRLHHKIGTADKPSSWETVEEYKKRNRDTLANPLDPVQDFFSDGRVQIDEVGGDVALGDLSDIEYFEGLLMMTAGVPPALLGGGREKSVNRDVLKEMEEDYFKVVADVNKQLEYGLRKVFNFQLLLGGINDEAVKYSFSWGAKDRDDADKKIARASVLQTLGFSFETIFRVCEIEGITLEDELERIHKQVEEGVIPYGAGMKLSPEILSFVLGITGATAKGEKSEQLLEQITKLRKVAEGYTSQLPPA